MDQEQSKISLILISHVQLVQRGTRLAITSRTGKVYSNAFNPAQH